MNTIPADDRGLVVPCPQCGQKNRIPFAKLAEVARCAKCAQGLGHVSRPVTVGDVAVFDALAGASKLPLLVDFWAAWCGPCLMVAPELEKVAAAEAGRVVVVKVNTDEVPELGRRFQVRSIPTLALLVGGREVGRDIGARPAEGIQTFLRSTLTGV